MSVVYTATVSGKTYGFDFDDQRIDVDATLNSMLVTDLYTAIKLAQASTEGISYPVIADGSGRNVLGAGVETYLTVTLKDNWEVLTLKATGKFEVFGGNLIRDDQGNPFRDNALITYISFMSQAGIATQVETGVSGLTPAESDQLADVLIIKADVSAIKTDVESTGVVVAASSKTGYRLSATGVQDFFDYVIEGTYTIAQYFRLIGSTLFGKIFGGGTNTIVIRDVQDTKDRIVATVDSNGNRSAFGTRDGT